LGEKTVENEKKMRNKANIGDRGSFNRPRKRVTAEKNTAKNTKSPAFIRPIPGYVKDSMGPNSIAKGIIYIEPIGDLMAIHMVITKARPPKMETKSDSSWITKTPANANHDIKHIKPIRDSTSSLILNSILCRNSRV
jgi:hypothetical protein